MVYPKRGCQFLRGSILSHSVLTSKAATSQQMDVAQFSHGPKLVDSETDKGLLVLQRKILHAWYTKRVKLEFSFLLVKMTN